VLFTRWNDRLPSSIFSSLLLEWTGEKGVFRRVGTAWLSSQYPLNHIISTLYEAQSIHFQDDDDDADSEGEACDEDAQAILGSSRTHTVEPNLQQNFMDSRTAKVPQMALKLARTIEKAEAQSYGTFSAERALLGATKTSSSISDLAAQQLPGQPS